MIEIVYLSRRNLLTLLSKLDRKAEGEDSACALRKQDTSNPKYPQSMPEIFVVAVEDDQYYNDRKPGEVYPLDDPARIHPLIKKMLDG